jgi:hypothetical protein
MPKYIGINLRDFHYNQIPGKAETRAQIRIIGAKNLEKAKEFFRTFYGKTAWLIARSDLTKNIAYATGKEQKEEVKES